MSEQSSDHKDDRIRKLELRILELEATIRKLQAENP